MHQKECISVKFSEGLGIFDTHYGYPEIDDKEIYDGPTGKVVDVQGIQAHAGSDFFIPEGKEFSSNIDQCPYLRIAIKAEPGTSTCLFLLVHEKKHDWNRRFVVIGKTPQGDCYGHLMSNYFTIEDDNEWHKYVYDLRKIRDEYDDVHHVYHQLLYPDAGSIREILFYSWTGSGTHAFHFNELIFAPSLEPQPPPQLSDRYPILLFPVRLETRFMRGPGDLELWVRIYPDQLCIDSHNPELIAEEKEAFELYKARLELVAADSLGEEEKKEKIRPAWRALASEVGPTRAAWIHKNRKNLSVISSAETPKVRVMPDYFVVRLYQYQDQDEDEKCVAQEPGKRIPDSLPVLWDITKEERDDELFDDASRWIIDFNAALDKGMAVKIPLNHLSREQLNKGFTRVIAIGVKTSANPERGAELLEDLINAHHYTDGIAFLEHGTPTNNTQSVTSGHSKTKRDLDHTYKMETESQYTWGSERCDAFQFSKALGIDNKDTSPTPDSIFNHIENAGSEENSYTGEMLDALWFGTWGYYLTALGQSPLMSEIAAFRKHYVNFVRPRGPLPALRIGNLPYGVLPVSKFREWNCSPDDWIFAFEVPRRLEKLFEVIDSFFYHLLTEMFKKFQKYAANPEVVPRAGATDDPDRELLRILAMEPTAITPGLRLVVLDEFVEQLAYYMSPRFFGQESIHDFREMNAYNWVEELKSVWQEALQENASLLHDITGLEANADISAPSPLLLRLIQWELSRSSAPLLVVSPENGEISLNDAGIFNLFVQQGKRLAEDLNADDETDKIDVAFDKLTEKYLFSWDEIPGNDSVRLKEFLTQEYGIDWVKTARIEKIDDDWTIRVTTGENFLLLKLNNEQTKVKLEIDDGRTDGFITKTEYGKLNIYTEKDPEMVRRLCRDCLDLSTPRLDAWITSLATRRLKAMRLVDGAKFKRGLYIGAYGWVEDLRPRHLAPDLSALRTKTTAVLTGVMAEGSLATETIARLTDASAAVISDRWQPSTAAVRPQVSAPDGGFIFTHSIGQANAAAVLRSAYISYAEDGIPEAAKLNLTSERVSLALRLIDGVRQGQLLGAILGYQFERGLHERSLDQFKDEFRSAFPIRAGKETELAEGETAEAVAARDVVDGLKLATKWRDLDPDAPGTLSALSSELSEDQLDPGLIIELNRLVDALDAVNDLFFAEAVFQGTQGNYERMAAVLDAAASAGPIPEIQCVRTPRSGLTHSHRVCALLNAQDSHPEIINSREGAEPHLNDWASKVLGMEGIQCKVRVQLSREQETVISTIISLAELGISALDFVYMATTPPSGEETELEQLIRYTVRKRYSLDAGVEVKLDLNDSGGDILDVELESNPSRNMAEAIEVAHNLLLVIGNATPLNPSMLCLPEEAGIEEETEGGVIEEQPALIGAFTRKDYEALWHRVNAARKGLYASTDRSRPSVKKRLQTAQRSADSYKCDALASARRFGIPGTIPNSSIGDKLIEKRIENALAEVNKREKKVDALLKVLKLETKQEGFDFDKGIRKLCEAMKALFGSSFTVLPTFQIPDEFAQALGAESLGDLGMDRIWLWLQQAAETHPALRRFETAAMMAEAWRSNPINEEVSCERAADNLFTISQPLELLVAQLPYKENDHWIALAKDEITDAADEEPNIEDQPQGCLSLVIHTPKNLDTGGRVGGILIDQWEEQIPSNQEVTAISYHYDQPSAQAPQAMLLAVPSKWYVEPGFWRIADLFDTVYDTMDLMKIRTVDLDALRGVGQFLPALYLSPDIPEGPIGLGWIPPT